jgi:hypothetical protein
MVMPTLAPTVSTTISQRGSLTVCHVLYLVVCAHGSMCTVSVVVVGTAY